MRAFPRVDYLWGHNARIGHLILGREQILLVKLAPGGCPSEALNRITTRPWCAPRFWPLSVEHHRHGAQAHRRAGDYGLSRIPTNGYKTPTARDTPERLVDEREEQVAAVVAMVLRDSAGASVVIASPGEISSFVKQSCP
jgi:hypothetical protein